MSDVKDSPDIDDVPIVAETPVYIEEIAQMDEDGWVLRKKDLQEFLFRREQNENSAYQSADFAVWINDHGKRFDQFYQHLRNTDPTLLIQWKKKALDDDEMNDAEFICEWATFRDSAK